MLQTLQILNNDEDFPDNISDEPEKRCDLESFVTALGKCDSVFSDDQFSECDERRLSSSSFGSLRIRYNRESLLQLQESPAIETLQKMDVDVKTRLQQKKSPVNFAKTRKSGTFLHRAENPWIPQSIRSKRCGEQCPIEPPDLKGKTLRNLNIISKGTYTKFHKKFLTLIEDNLEFVDLIIDVLILKAIEDDMYRPIYSMIIQSLYSKSSVIKDSILDLSQASFQRIFDNGMDNLKKITELKLALDNETNESKKLELMLDIQERSDVGRFRSFGTIELIAELYRRNIMGLQVVMNCFIALVLVRDDHSYECLCKFLTRIGHNMEMEMPIYTASRLPTLCPSVTLWEKAFVHIRNTLHLNNLSKRVKFAVMDLLELRENDWKPRNENKIDQTGEHISLKNEETEQILAKSPNFKMEHRMLKTLEFEISTNGVSPSDKESPGIHVISPIGSERKINSPLKDAALNKTSTPLTVPAITITVAENTEEQLCFQSKVQVLDQGKEYSSGYIDPSFAYQVNMVLDKYLKNKRIELGILNIIHRRFPAEDVLKFVDVISRKILRDVISGHDQKTAALLIISLIKNGTISKAEVLIVLKNGVMKDISTSLIRPQGIRQLAGYIVEIFLHEPDLFWLKTLTDTFSTSSTLITDFYKKCFEILKIRLNLNQFKALFRSSNAWDWMDGTESKSPNQP